MAENRRESRGRQRRRNPSHRKIQRASRIIDGADFISSMPDEILHHILSFNPSDLAVRTSVLSSRWRHVWCEAPSLCIDGLSRTRAGGIKQTLVSYTAPKIVSFKLRMCLVNSNTASQVDSCIEFAISRNVEKLSVEFKCMTTYSFPHCFYLSSSVKQLSVRLSLFDMIPSCTVSWKSLRTLSLSECLLRDESIANILSGCSILESLTLFECRSPERLDLSKSSLTLRRLEIDRLSERSGPIEIVAPHIHYLRLKTVFDKPCTLVDVSSLTEANLYTRIFTLLPSEADVFQTRALEMLAKSHNVERLTVRATHLQILSLAGLRGVPFPELKVQTLIVITEFARSVIPGIARLLQNSPGLKKLTVHMMPIHHIKDMYLDSYLISQGFNPNKCWRSKYEVFPTSHEIYSMLGCNDATSKLLASFMALVLRNAKTLETIVVWLGGVYFNDAQWFEQLRQMVGTLSHNNNVSILLKRSNC